MAQESLRNLTGLIMAILKGKFVECKYPISFFVQLQALTFLFSPSHCEAGDENEKHRTHNETAVVQKLPHLL